MSRGTVNWKKLIPASSNMFPNVPKSKPWISHALLKKINEKRKSWHRYKASNSEVDYHHYRTLCNTVTKNIRDAKAKYEHDLVTSNSSKKFFRHIQSTVQSRVSTPVLKNNSRTLIYDPKDVANMFATEFKNSFISDPSSTFPTITGRRNERCLGTIEITEAKRIERWCKDWLLDFDENKSSIVHIGRNNPRRQYTLNNQTIKAASSQEDLGVVVSADLRWAPHVGKVVKWVDSMSYMISRTFTNPSPKLWKKSTRSTLDLLWTMQQWCGVPILRRTFMPWNRPKEKSPDYPHN
ncbi:hypothetical protein QE152_g30647 [Popillia japonica]|uniref:Reverse transcriptase n=1 Tax=Popillia japonica TaxID=7064 RepID=A0AAW1JDS9_POPJA